MLQLGNLAIICAERTDILLSINKGTVTVLVDSCAGGPLQLFNVDWRDNEEIGKLIYELNHGSLRKEDHNDSKH